ncbi:21573_t:CDS:1, partial [Racocetra persica]
VDDKAKGPAIKEKSSKPSKPASGTMTSVFSDGKKTTEDRKNEEIIQKNVETIKKEDQEPETKPREKT